MSTPASPLCAYCRAPLSRPGARFCTTCGREQPAAAAPPPVAPPPPAPVPAAPPPTVGFGATLQVQEDGQVRTVALGAAPITLGRAADNTLVIASRFVSGRHARIEPSGQAHRIVDVGSTNGLLYD